MAGDMKQIYLDHSATTPVHSEVLEAMLPYFGDLFGNPSSIHSFGQDAKKALDEARDKVASLINADPSEIVFTSGGTEADNLAVIGVAYVREEKNHIITTSIEHPAVLNTCEYLERKGLKVTYLPVDRYGLVDPDDVKRAITAETAIISIMHANNEIGTIEPIEEIGRIAEENGISFHTDAVQTVGKIPVNVSALNVDLLSLSGHKIYGPKGIGALYIRKGTRIAPILYGGHHERDLRAGTENVPGIVGLGRACEIASRDLTSQMDYLRNLRDRLENGIMDRIDRIRVNGHPSQRLPHILNVSFENIEGEPVILYLDMKGIAASAGSACTSGAMESSHVLKALGIPPDIARGSVRFSLGRKNTEKEVDYVIDALVDIVEHLRDVSPRVDAIDLKKQCAITFYEVPDALRAEKVLKGKELKFTLSSVPPQISRPSCCGVALLFSCEDREEVGDFLKEQDVEVEGIYQLEGNNVLLKRKKRKFLPFGG